MRELKDRVLTERELFFVLADLTRRAKRSKESQQNLLIYRLAVCCGLRPREIAGLKLRDVALRGYPRMELCGIRLSDGKATRKARTVYYGFDDPTQECIERWRNFRLKQSGRDLSAPFICGLREPNLGQPLSSKTLARRWKAAIRCLGPARVRQLSISSGRHSCAVQFFRRGGSWLTVQNHLGLPSIYDTRVYSDLVPGLRGGPGRVFSF